MTYRFFSSPGNVKRNVKAVTVVSFVIALFLFLASWIVFFYAPDVIKDQHFWSQLKEIGPAIAGSWVLCAAVLAITAAGMTALVTLTDSDDRSRARERAIKRVCLGEIKAFWDRCNRLELHAKLEGHIGFLQVPGFKHDAFRRNMGDDFFVFFRVDPEALGELDEELSARYIALSARARNFMSRLNYLNSCEYDASRSGFWVDYHKYTLENLNQLYAPSEDVIERLNSGVDPRTFVF